MVLLYSDMTDRQRALFDSIGSTSEKIRAAQAGVGLDKLAEDEKMSVRVNAAMNREAPPSLVGKLADDDDDLRVRSAALENPACPETAILDWVERGTIEIPCMAKNTGLTQKAVWALMRHGGAEALKLLSSNPATPPEALMSGNENAALRRLLDERGISYHVNDGALTDSTTFIIGPWEYQFVDGEKVSPSTLGVLNYVENLSAQQVVDLVFPSDASRAQSASEAALAQRARALEQLVVDLDTCRRQPDCFVCKSNFALSRPGSSASKDSCPLHLPTRDESSERIQYGYQPA